MYASQASSTGLAISCFYITFPPKVGVITAVYPHGQARGKFPSRLRLSLSSATAGHARCSHVREGVRSAQSGSTLRLTTVQDGPRRNVYSFGSREFHMPLKGCQGTKVFCRVADGGSFPRNVNFFDLKRELIHYYNFYPWRSWT